MRKAVKVKLLLKVVIRNKRFGVNFGEKKKKTYRKRSSIM